MSFKYTLKATCAAVALIAGSAANAGLFYVDIGNDYSNALGQVTPTSTSMKDEFQFKYTSSTTISDTDGSGSISAGDFLSTDGGFGVAGATLGNNLITNFIPSQTLGTESNNGLNDFYSLSFRVTDLLGQVTGITNGVPTFAYGPGLLEMLITTDRINFDNFMDIKISGGGATGVSTILLGEVDFTNVSGNYKNLFNSGSTTCNGKTGFFDIWNECDGMPIAFSSTQDANVLASAFAYDPLTGLFSLTTNHNGSGTFDVPEPGSIALLGLALAGLGMTQRRRKLAK